MLYPQIGFTYFASFFFWLGGAAPPDMGDMGFDFPVSSKVLIA
jgi:hypothetical protein